MKKNNMEYKHKLTRENTKEGHKIWFTCSSCNKNYIMLWKDFFKKYEWLDYIKCSCWNKIKLDEFRKN